MLEYKQISMLDFRKRAENVVREVAAGQEYVLTYRGKPMVKMIPAQRKVTAQSDPFFELLDELSGVSSGETEVLTNEEMDRLIYE